MGLTRNILARQEYLARYAETHREQIALARKDWAKRNPGKYRAMTRVAAWKRQGISLTWAEYLKRFEDQNHLCASCREPMTIEGRQCNVDHCHKTGKIRGLLCGSCNSALGLLKESPARIAYLLLYLERSNGPEVWNDGAPA